MKTRLFSLLTALCAAGLLALYAAADTLPIGIHIDGKPLITSDAPFEENGSVLLPLRAVAQALHCVVTWNEKTEEITLKRESDVIVFKAGDAVMLVNGAPVSLPHAAVLVHDKTYVPVRAISEAFGYTVGWDGDASIVGICTRDNEHIVSVGDYAVIIGGSTQLLEAAFGSPHYVMLGENGLRWYIYDYYVDAFLAVATDGGIVCGCYTCSSHFSTSFGLAYGLSAVGTSSLVQTRENDLTIYAYYDLPSAFLYAVSVMADGYENIYDTDTSMMNQARIGLDILNAFRYRHDLYPLSWDDAAAAASRDQASYIARVGKITHTGENGSTGLERYRVYEPHAHWSSWGENLCAGGKNIFLVINAFINNSGYRRIVLSDKARAGIGMIYDPAGIYQYTAAAFFIK